MQNADNNILSSYCPASELCEADLVLFPRNNLHFSGSFTDGDLRYLKISQTLKEMGFSNVRSLKTGLRGWNDYEMPMVRQDGEAPVIEANADKYCTPQVREDQFKPKGT